MNSEINQKDRKQVLFILETLQEKGHQAFLVGGCVRDLLLKKEPNDYDIATSATPDEVEEIFPRTNPIGKKFGTIQVIVEEKPYEVTTFRKDFAYSDGRRPDHVVFGSLEEDAKRRDFTINALYYDLAKDKIQDPTGGREDLKKKKIRFIGDAKERMDEDRLRLLRAIRFQSQLDFVLEDSAKVAIKEYADKLKGVSWERIHIELTKWLKGEYLLQTLEILKSSDLFKEIFGNSDYDLEWLDKVKSFHFEQTYPCFLVTQNSQLKLEEIKLSREEMKIYQKMRSLLKENFDPTDLLIHYSNPIGTIAKAYFKAKQYHHPLLDVFPDSYPHHHDLPEPLVSGKDLLKEGFSQGEKLGKILEKLYKIQIKKSIHSKVELLEYISDK